MGPTISRLVPRVGLSALLVVICAAASASAQTPTRDRPFPQIEDPRRWGPFLVERTFNIDNVGYDSNVFLVPEELGRESDFVIALGPEVRAQTRFGSRMALTLRDRLSGEIFLDHPELNHADNEFDGQFDLLVGPFLLSSAGEWKTSRQRLTSEFDDRTRRDERLLSQSMRAFLGSRSDLLIRLEGRRIRYQDADRLVLIDPDGDGTGDRVSIGEALDRDDERLVVEAGWRSSRGLRFFVRHEETDSDFASEGAGRDSEARESHVGVELLAGSSIRGRVSVGNAELENVDPRFDFTPFNGGVSDVRVTLIPSGITRITLRHENDVGFSTFDRNLYFEEETVFGSIESFVGGRWGLEAGWERRELDYPEPNSVIRPIGERRFDEIENTFAGILFRLGQGVELGLRFGVRERVSNVIAFEDTQKYVTTTGSYDF